jgi:hypothetical protein
MSKRTPRLRPRGSAPAGIAVAAAVIAIAALAVWALQQRPAPTYSQAYVPTLESALSTVPARDVPGVDVAGLPRPPGSVRGFSQVRGRTTLVVYSEHAALPDVIAALRQALPAAGWSKEGADGTVPSESQSWVALFIHDSSVAQVSVTTAKAVTATTYIVQNA